VLQLVKEAVQYEPDLFVVYTGVNEFRDANFHYWELKRSALEARILRALLSSKTIYLLREGVLKLETALLGPRQISRGGRHIANILSQPFSADTFKSSEYYTVPELVYKTEAPSGEPSLAQRVKARSKTFMKRVLRTGYMRMSDDEVYDIFRRNIMQMVEIAQHHNINLILIKMARNTKVKNLNNTTRYTITMPRAMQDPDVEKIWKSGYEEGVRNLRKSEYAKALAALKRVQALDYVSEDRLLDLYIGICYEALGEYEQAVVAYERRFPGRHHRLNHILEEIAFEYHLPVLDTFEVLKAESLNGIVGYNLFVDSYHMNLKAYKVIGTALANLLDEKEYIKLARPQTNLTVEGNQKVTYFSKANDTHFLSAEADVALGWSALNQGRLGEALRMAEKAVRKDPQEIQAHLLLGYVYSRLERLEDAESKWHSIKSLYEERAGR
jgi:Flp pilus assembly protein TadD